jgi:hypothetical protein
MLIYLVQLFNEEVLRPSAVVVDVAMRTPRALYFGFRAGAAEAGLNLVPASIFSGFAVAVLMLALLWIFRALARRARIKNPGPIATWLGNILFWFGCAVGVYFFGMLFFVLALPDNRPSQLLWFVGGTAILWPAGGWLAGYLLGRGSPKIGES